MEHSPVLPCGADALRDRVVETIRKHWVRPHSAERPEVIPPDRVEKTARAVLDCMLTRQFRVGPLPPDDVYDQLLERVRRRVRKGQPIKVTLGYGPLKNQHAVPYSRADWAEFFALGHLAAWHNKVQALYLPGLYIQIVFDDTTLVMANRADRGLIKSYMSTIAELIRALGYEVFMAKPFAHSSFSWLFHFGYYQIARWRVRRWERNPANRAQLERMTEFAGRNLILPPGLSPEERERCIRDASHRYRVYWDALQLSGLTSSKSRLVAMYLDGSQHHLRQSVALHLTTLDKGQVTQPWQGEGALLDNGHGKLEPFVLTNGRRDKHRVQTVEGLDIIPQEGFERIAIAWPTLPAEKAPVAPAVQTSAVNVVASETI